MTTADSIIAILLIICGALCLLALIQNSEIEQLERFIERWKK